MFSFLKKKKSPVDLVEQKPKIILCIPGNWEDRRAFLSSIVEHNSTEFVFAGMLLLNTKTNKSFEVEICDRDDRMKESFKWAGMVNRVSEDFLNEIDKHKSVIYLSSESVGPENAKAIAEAGRAVLRSGGIGLKIETTGKAFSKEQWLAQLDNFEYSNLYQMFVLDSISDGKAITYSCGMHNLGLKDTIVYNEEFQEAVNLISIFNYYQFIEKPIINFNQTFSIEANAPVFVITEEKDQPNKGDELFENPFGVWKLERKSNR